MSNGRLPECETCQYFKNLLREINRSALQTEFKLAKLASINTDLLKALEAVAELDFVEAHPYKEEWIRVLSEANQALKKARGE